MAATPPTSAGLARVPTVALARIRVLRGRAAMPTFAANNLSIVTGAPPSVHGSRISRRPRQRREIMMNEARYGCAARRSYADVAGRESVAAIRQDKLRRMLGSGLSWVGAASAFRRRLDRCTGRHGIEGVEALVGRSRPDMYSADLSLFVLDAGIRLVEQRRAQLLYLSLSDYVQHGHAPGETPALEFHRALDDRLARLEELGCVVAVTADHGMNDKAFPDGRPHVLFLEDLLNARFGEGAVRVICPITDPFVRHHGARLLSGLSQGGADRSAAEARALPGIDAVLTREEASARYRCPGPRGRPRRDRRPQRIDRACGGHDVRPRRIRLRSHGGAAEQTVPFLLPPARRITVHWRVPAPAFRYLQYALNGTAS